MSILDRFKGALSFIFGRRDAHDELAYKMTPPITDELAHKMTPAGTDELANKYTPPATDELAMKMAPPLSDELIFKMAPPITDELAYKLTSSITDGLAYKLTSSITDGLVGERRDTMRFRAYMSITGSKQGAFKGESMQDPRKHKIAILSLAYELSSPRDPRTGQASGKRQHQPITIVKDLGAASPQIFQALITNEVLTEILFEFYAITAQGVEELWYTIKCANGSVANLRLYSADRKGEAFSLGNRPESSETAELEEVSFTFQTIQVEHQATQTTAVDNWAK
jgi:type VI secretion system secreted protein Hcp